MAQRAKQPRPSARVSEYLYYSNVEPKSCPLSLTDRGEDFAVSKLKFEMYNVRIYLEYIWNNRLNIKRQVRDEIHPEFTASVFVPSAQQPEAKHDASNILKTAADFSNQKKLVTVH